MVESLRIAFVTPRFAPQLGGAETYTRCVLSELATAGHEVEVVAGTAPGLPSQDVVAGLRVLRSGPSRGEALVSRGGWLPGFTRAAVQALRTIRPDALVAQYSALVPASRYAREAGVPLVALVHAVFPLGELVRTRGAAAGTLRYLFGERLIGRSRPDTVVTPSEATARAARPLVQAPVYVTGAGVDHVQEGPPPQEDSMRMIFVGRLVASKGIRDAVAAAAEVRERLPQVELMVVGSGSESRALPAWVKAVEHLDGADLDREVRSSGVLILPSTQEGWGLVLCEAAARGVPYVAYDIPAVREQHDIVEGGLLVEPRDVAGLGRAVERLLSDRALWRRLSAIGRERAREHLRWRDAAQVMESAILEAGRRGPRAR